MSGEVPEDWQTAKVGDLVSIKTGKLDANAAVKGGQYKFFTCSRNDYEIDSYSFDADAIIIAGNGDLNVKRYCGKFDAYQRTYVLTSKNTNILDTNYFFFWESIYVDRLRDLSIGGVIKYIKLGMLADVEIPIPPLPEQQRIAEILSSVDESIRATESVIAQAERVKQCLVDQFATGKSHFQPDYWVKISDIALINPRTSLVRGKVYPFIEMANLPIGSPDILRIEEKEFSNGGAKFAVGDTLFARITPCTENGKLGFVSELQTESVAFGSTEFIVLRPKDNKVRPKLIYYYCYSNHVRQKAIQKMIGSTGRQRVPNHVFDEIQVPVYSPQSQSVFEDTFGSLDDQITTNRATVEQLQRLKRGLMDDLLTGKVRTVA